MTGSNIISAIHSLKIAQEHFADFRREYPTSAGAKLFKGDGGVGGTGEGAGGD